MPLVKQIWRRWVSLTLPVGESAVAPAYPIFEKKDVSLFASGGLLSFATHAESCAVWPPPVATLRIASVPRESE